MQINDDKQEQLNKAGSKGVFSPKLIRGIAFLVITISLVFSAVFSILAIWEAANPRALWRAAATFAVLGIAFATFTFVNEKLG